MKTTPHLDSRGPRERHRATRKSTVPKDAKKARKSAALIVAEKDIEALKAGFTDLRTLLLKIAGVGALLLISVLGFLLAPHFSPPH